MLTLAPRTLPRVQRVQQSTGAASVPANAGLGRHRARPFPQLQVSAATVQRRQLGPTTAHRIANHVQHIRHVRRALLMRTAMVAVIVTVYVGMVLATVHMDRRRLNAKLDQRLNRRITTGALIGALIRLKDHLRL